MALLAAEITVRYGSDPPSFLRKLAQVAILFNGPAWDDTSLGFFSVHPIAAMRPSSPL
ncbi:MAG: hypothetical protein JOZ19_13745 [Rubrobacter sp.]|nr:hypothetical protein [Rubrobacter sp.]